MKTILMASAIALAASTSAFAQAGESSTRVPDPTSVTGSVGVSVEQQRAVRTYWQAERPRATVLPNGVVVSRGAVLPEAVELRTFPAEVGITQYRYVVVGDNLYLVNPSDRRIVQVIE
ncbi:DUF1236 domain-containing protein [Phreatobacter oligotrophus]|jgi:hypothetical protein|uniref:DUF1236 domain-containing protein n=1 Tax=Phreatobacter oligotrophus TaxID=1122261 RepID=UPI002356BA73|nr:DUF1236 domain-containing protein [Phreatobacter oligotrophus]MBX9990753.1 DUF1236 domain-containing protein [Phreatobacter oligotrophus]